jgi:hypothetical protein
MLPRALRALAHGVVGHRRTGLTLRPTWQPSPARGMAAGLTGRATCVPEAAVTSGIQRTTTVTRRGPLGWAPRP